MVTKLVALLSVLAISGGIGTAVAQQAPTENMGMKAEALSGFALGKQGLDDFAQRQMPHPADYPTPRSSIAIGFKLTT